MRSRRHAAVGAAVHPDPAAGAATSASVLVSTSSYHRLRCALLFRLAGFDSSALPTTSDRPYLGWSKWLRYVIKEWMATPWDAVMLLWHRFRRTI